MIFASSRTPPPVPPPPWHFSDARILYQPALVRTDAARTATAPLAPSPSELDAGGESGPLTLLSLFGYTLGGVFVVDWPETPVGPYREVAVLSGLVSRGLSFGAWASDIVVTTDVAAGAGRDLFGLPTRVGRIALEGGNSRTGSDGADDKREMKYGGSVDFLSNDEVRVAGWDGWSTRADDATEPAGEKEAGNVWPSVSLPSFSGCLPSLPIEEDTSSMTPLLKYPLRLGPARAVALRRPMKTTMDRSRVSERLVSILEGLPLGPCIQLDGVQVAAGVPVSCGSSFHWN